MTKFETLAPAKVNLALHVTGQRADGYHLLDSLVVFAEAACDRLAFEPGPALSLEVTGPFADGVPTDHRNLVWRAAECVGFQGLIQLEKNLPHGAGIGGGSADAAAVLRGGGGGGGGGETPEKGGGEGGVLGGGGFGRVYTFSFWGEGKRTPANPHTGKKNVFRLFF